MTSTEVQGDSDYTEASDAVNADLAVDIYKGYTVFSFSRTEMGSNQVQSKILVVEFVFSSVGGKCHKTIPQSSQYCKCLGKCHLHRCKEEQTSEVLTKFLQSDILSREFNSFSSRKISRKILTVETSSSVPPQQA